VPGPPVLLVHGLAASAASTWREAGWLDLLADAGRDVVAVDLPGHGGTPMPDPPADPGLVDFVLAAVPDEPVQAIGFSLGARTLLTAITQAPERFDRVVLSGIGGRLLGPDDGGSRMMADRLEAEDADDPMGRYFLDHAKRSGTRPADLARMLRLEWPALTPERFAVATMPVLVVVGERDAAAGPAAPLADALPNATAVTLPGVDHFATPKAFAFLDAAFEFLGVQL
jgi:pimeloyl-ACP methyl ester carboxylesterase